ncbi:MAG: hypothetical protein WBB01_02585 [Phormidesmis sp.]
MPAPTSADVSRHCNPIGAISRGSSDNFRRRETVCEGQVVRQPREVQFLCFSTGAMISLSGEDVPISESTCENATVSNPRVRPCPGLNIFGRLCLNPRGPEDQFQLIEPEAVSENPRPAISWEAVAEAESYTVQVTGPYISWERTVDGESTELSYPEDEPSMVEGNAYEVIVLASRPDTVVTASKVVNIQSHSELISLKSE